MNDKNDSAKIISYYSCPNIDLKEKSDRLNYYYNLYKKNPDSTNYCVGFFKYFPCNFKEIYEIYVYQEAVDGKKEKLPLNENGYYHIRELFNNLDCVSDTIYYQKLINISIGGFWKADDINFFHKGLTDKVINNIDLVLYSLSNKNDVEIESFFKFLFDGPHPPRKIDINLLRIKDKDKRVFEIMEKAHYELQK
ncbi:MAG TPA: hypothetical protein PKL31_17790 [Fulvivirga sp.]|nr:hypothetical protein [Fulvivirga sp.]